MNENRKKLSKKMELSEIDPSNKRQCIDKHKPYELEI